MYGAAGKCFIREDPATLMSELQEGIADMETRKDALQRRERGLVMKLEEVQRDLNSMVTG